MKLAFFPARIFVFSLLLSTLIISCGKQPEKPVTPEEAREFAKQVQSTIEKRDPSFYDKAIDKKTFLKKAGLEKEARGFGAQMDQNMRMGTSLTNGMSKKGTYQLVKQYEKDNVQHVLFRMYDDGALNYHDIELVRAGKEIKMADMFVYTSGEYLSETIKGLYEQMEAMTGGKTSGKDQWVLQVPRMRQLMQQKKPQEALDVYNALPENVKRLRAVQLMHVLISSSLDDTEQYSAAIDQYKTLYPNEPNMHLLLLDGYILKREFDQALNAINELDKMINKDPLLDYYRYLCYNLKEKKDSAKISLEHLMTNMPDFEDGMLEYIAQHIEEKKNDLADQWIEKYKSKSSFDQNRLKDYLDAYGYTPGTK